MSELPARRALGADERGATLVEFAFVIGPLMLILLATFDLGYRTYMASVVQGTVQAAARRATIGDQTAAQIDTFVRSQLTNFSRNATVAITKKSYADFTGVQQLESADVGATFPYDSYNAGYVKPNGTIVNGDCYDDVNNDWKRDDMGVDGIGAADQIVYYEVKVTFPRIVPMKLAGWGNDETVSASTMLRNQPYSATSVTTPPRRCYEK